MLLLWSRVKAFTPLVWVSRSHLHDGTVEAGLTMTTRSPPAGEKGGCWRMGRTVEFVEEIVDDLQLAGADDLAVNEFADGEVGPGGRSLARRSRRSACRPGDPGFRCSVVSAFLFDVVPVASPEGQIPWSGEGFLDVCGTDVVDDRQVTRPGRVRARCSPGTRWSAMARRPHRSGRRCRSVC